MHLYACACYFCLFIPSCQCDRVLGWDYIWTDSMDIHVQCWPKVIHRMMKLVGSGQWSLIAHIRVDYTHIVFNILASLVSTQVILLLHSGTLILYTSSGRMNMYLTPRYFVSNIHTKTLLLKEISYFCLFLSSIIILMFVHSVLQNLFVCH